VGDEVIRVGQRLNRMLRLLELRLRHEHLLGRVLDRARMVLHGSLELRLDPRGLQDSLDLLGLGDILGKRDLDHLRHGTTSASRAVAGAVSCARSRSSSRNVASCTSTSAPRAASSTESARAVSPLSTTLRPARGGPSTSSGVTTVPSGSCTDSPAWSSPRSGP